jgi:hypothetical protein
MRHRSLVLSWRLNKDIKETKKGPDAWGCRELFPETSFHTSTRLGFMTGQSLLRDFLTLSEDDVSRPIKADLVALCPHSR